MAGKKKDKDFGVLISELEDLVAVIEDDDCSLDDALKTFETGIAMVRDAQKRLAEMEQKVQLLTATGTGPTATNEDDEEAP